MVYSMTAPLPSANIGVTSVPLYLQLQRSTLTLKEETFAAAADSQSSSRWIELMWCAFVPLCNRFELYFPSPVAISCLAERSREGSKALPWASEHPFTHSPRRRPPLSRENSSFSQRVSITSIATDGWSRIEQSRYRFQIPSKQRFIRGDF